MDDTVTNFQLAPFLFNLVFNHLKPLLDGLQECFPAGLSAAHQPVSVLNGQCLCHTGCYIRYHQAMLRITVPSCPTLENRKLSILLDASYLILIPWTRSEWSFFFPKDFIYLFLQRGEGREKERERNIDM